LFNANTQATVICRNFNGLASISKDNLEVLFNTYPEYKDALKKYCQKYNDPRTVFIQKMIRRVPFFKDVSKTSLLKIQYSLKEQIIEKGQYITGRNTLSDKIIFIE